MDPPALKAMARQRKKNSKTKNIKYLNFIGFLVNRTT